MTDGPGDWWHDAAAERVVWARLEAGPLDAFPLEWGLGQDDGYGIQERANRRLTTKLGAVGGYKIAGSNPIMRPLAGITGPVSGAMFASTIGSGEGRVRYAAYRRPGVETEIAVRLAKALPAKPQAYTRVEVATAVATVMPAIELVDDRYVNFRTAGAAAIVADNAFNAGCVLGQERSLAEVTGLDRLGARLSIDGRLVALGRSDALLGHPLDALAWLANERARLGLGLPAGCVISLGSMTPVHWLTGPCCVTIDVEALGAVWLLVD